MNCSNYNRNKIAAAVLSVCGVLFVSAPASAEQGIIKTVDTIWAGPYAGAYLGGAWAHSGITTTTGPVTESPYFASAGSNQAVSQTGSSSTNSSAFLGGIQIGDNWTYKSVLIGWVLDYGAFHISNNENNTALYPGSTNTYVVNTNASTDWLVTTRARLGISPNTDWPTVIYLTGGMALTKMDVSGSYLDTRALAGVGGNSSSQDKIGWTAGAGVEFFLVQNVTLDAEYMYVNFGSISASGNVINRAGVPGIPASTAVSSFNTSNDLYANLFRIGLNYKFS